MSLRRYVVGWGGDWSPALNHPLAQGRIIFDLELSQEIIQSLEFSFGSNHRGDEKLLEVRDYRQGLSHINRPAALHPIAAELGYARAAEKLMGLTPPPRALALRDLVLQLQAVIGRNRFFDAVNRTLKTPDPTFAEVTETLTTWHERFTGARLHDAFIRLGGVGSDIAQSDLVEFAEFLAQLTLPSTPRFEISAVAANKLQHLIQSHQLGDLQQAVQSAIATEGAFAVQLPKVVKVPRGEHFETVAAWHGDFGVWLFSDGGKSPARVHLVPAGLENLLSLKAQAIGLNLLELQELLTVSAFGIGEIER